MHTKQSGKLCYLTTAHTNQTIESQSLNFNYGRKTMRVGRSMEAIYSMRNIVTMTEYERYVINLLSDLWTI